MKELSGKRALVTGGGRGIGRVVALDLARQGVSVAVSSRTRGRAGRGGGRGGGARGRVGRGALRRLEGARTCARRSGRPARRSAASTSSSTAPASRRRALVARTTDELWHQAIETNLSGAFYCLREALPEMAERGWGRVVNVASIAGKRGAAYIAAYSASKHGLLGLTKCAALEVVEKGVTVNAVCPGYVDTPMTDAGVDAHGRQDRPQRGRDPQAPRGHEPAEAPLHVRGGLGARALPVHGRRARHHRPGAQRSTEGMAL